MLLRFKPILSLQSTFKLVFATVILLSPLTVFAEVCVWRNPERTMIKIFPEASDYKTITKEIGLDKKEAIEKRLGEPISPDESKEWMYYEITGKNGESLGYISADAETGEYGVIEMVMGITLEGKVQGLYIQRAREKDKGFQSKAFLDQFMGKAAQDSFKDISVAKDSVAQQKVVFGVRKMLIFYEELGK